MLNGDQRILCEKPQYMSDWRQSVPSAKYFFRHAPNNVCITELEGSAQEFCGWQAAVAYVITFESPATRMDSESAERFLDLLRAKDRDALQTASSRLGLIRREDDPVLPGELSIARLRTVLTGKKTKGPRRRSQNPSSQLMRSRSRSCVPSGNTFPHCRQLRRCARCNS